ncbi:nuclear transport factor 2 family protein [Streptococcus sp. H31]|uniref:nuclear transport factor 2 family protein n=1 Tax=Streptococcus huangxiaojuni TaxID=3237239 RepID=UPI0034A41B36
MQEDEKEIVALQHEIWKAIIDKDFERLYALYPENHLFRHVGGYCQTREEYFETIRSGTFSYYTYVPISETVRLVGEERAILHAKAKTDARIYGFRKVWTMDFELPFEKVEGRWQPANDC